ncbi:hypothetical protein Godav_012354, partial [Gossypium davidsonii]|nr:hypothetical protein [Gossypium davidsonii]MBA0646813.1 hypothetical protein [Gossypium klotzschianum]
SLQGAFPTVWIHKTYSSKVDTNPYDYKALQKYLCQLNRTIPIEIWPLGDVLAPWDFDIEPPTPYQMELKKALKKYQENILDLKEWSQDYPWFCSNAWKDTPAWDKDKSTPMDLDSSTNESKWEEKLYRAKLDKEIRIEEQNLTSDVNTEYSD